MIEELAFVFLGMALGTVTGLVPGIHANTIAAIALLSPAEKTLGFSLLIISMSVTHSFLDAIPNILLGAASEESFLSIMPGQRMLLEGRGIEAVMLTVFGGVTTTVFVVLFSPFLFSFTLNYGEELPLIIPALLVLVIAIMVLGESKKMNALAVIMMSGALGIVALDSGIKNSILALVIGFFAVPGMLFSVFSRPKIPEQEKPRSAHSISAGAVAGMASGFTSVFPGIGPSVAAFVTKKLWKKMKREDYLIMIGGMNTGNLIFSILALFVLEKTRTGMAVALNSIAEINTATFMLFGTTAVASAGFSALIAEKAAHGAAGFFRKTDYGKMSLGILALLVFIVYWFSGFWGLVACIAATGISAFGMASKVKRSNAMAFLMVPAMLFYLGARF